MQMPRCVWIVHRENMLANVAQFSPDRWCVDEEVLQGQARHGRYTAFSANDSGLDFCFAIEITRISFA